MSCLARSACARLVSSAAFARGSLAIVVVLGGEPEILVALRRQLAPHVGVGDNRPGLRGLGIGRIGLRREVRASGIDVAGGTVRVTVSLVARGVGFGGQSYVWFFRMLHRPECSRYRSRGATGIPCIAAGTAAGPLAALYRTRFTRDLWRRRPALEDLDHERGNAGSGWDLLLRQPRIRGRLPQWTHHREPQVGPVRARRERQALRLSRKRYRGHSRTGRRRASSCVDRFFGDHLRRACLRAPIRAVRFELQFRGRSGFRGNCKISCLVFALTFLAVIRPFREIVVPKL